MAKRRAGSQTANLTPDHKKSGIDSIYLAAGGVPHIVGKLLTRATTLLWTTSQSEVCSQSYGAPKLRKSHLARFRDSHSGVPGKIAIWMYPSWRAAEYTIRGKVVASPKSGL
jgi:hypothetical protein